MELMLSRDVVLDPNQPVVAGVSGGADSLCLLGLLLEAGCQVVVAHLDHNLRPESTDEAAFVEKIAKDLQIPFIGKSMDVAEFAHVRKLSIEDAARKCRYQFLFDVARQRNAQAVAVAHTADDQVETILMHLIRGTGLSGLKGMTPLSRLVEFDNEIPLLRPILHFWRKDTEAYCRQKGWDFILDSSNADQTYFRNWLRLSLIPELETYNPLFKKAVIRMSRSLQDDHEILSNYIDEVWDTTVADEGDGYVTFHLHDLQNLSTGMRRNLFKRAMHQLRPGLRDVDFDILEKAAQFVSKSGDIPAVSPSRKLDLTGGMYLYQEGDRLFIAAYEADLPSADWPQVAGRIPVETGVTELGNGWQLSCELISGETLYDQAIENDDAYVAWLDEGEVLGNFSLRPPQAGDVFQPFGMDGQSTKLSDFFVNIKLPKRARHHWPLLISGNEIAWVVGLRLAHPYRLNQSSTKALRLQLKRLP